MSIAARLPSLIFRLSVRQYHHMIQSGILGEDDPVELLDGVLVRKMPKKPRHRIATKRVRNALEGIVPTGWYVDSQEPITLKNSEPEPDTMIVRGETDDYSDRHPGAKDVELVVEVAEASLERDRDDKKRVYAQARIPCYWIVNLRERCVEVQSEPFGGRLPDYRNVQTFQSGERVPLILDGAEVGRVLVDDLLPQPKSR